jgi:hypothetical protein
MTAGMTAVRRLAVTVGLVLAASGGVLIGSAGTASADNGGPGAIKPILECVYRDTGTGQYNALWGYTNGASVSVTVPSGSGNGFSPAPVDRGQPTTFSPGTHDNVFATSWSASGDLTWSLGHSATASISSTACATNPVPIAGSQTLTWALLALGFVGTALVAARLTGRDRRASVSTT